MQYLDIIIGILALVQILCNFLLPPEQAKKFNFVGKALDTLAKTKGGMSCKKDSSEQ